MADLEREAFERYVQSKFPGASLGPRVNNCGIACPESYGHPKIEFAWQAWQAAKAWLSKTIETAPIAIMDTRDVLGICAPKEDDFPALYALQGKRVKLVLVDDVDIDNQARAQSSAPPVSADPEYVVPSSAPPALYQHDDGRYALALGDVARHKLTDRDPGWHRVPLDQVVGSAPPTHVADARKMVGDGDRRDAERYRWLRIHFKFANDSTRELFFDGHVIVDEPIELDEAIDAAMASEVKR